MIERNSEFGAEEGAPILGREVSVDLANWLETTLEVRAVFAEKTLELGTVVEFAPGTILRLGSVLELRPEIRIGNRTIGVGRPVEVDGRLAVRLDSVRDAREFLVELRSDAAEGGTIEPRKGTPVSPGEPSVSDEA